MYDIIRKAELFDWWEAGLADKNAWHLKGIQDAWIVSELRDAEGLRICEVGGGDSRVLRRLAEKNTCVNVDRFEGASNGPQDVPEIAGVEIVRSFMGDFDPALADSSFDVLFSISVIEHVADEDVHVCFKDMARLLKPGGRMLHAIDVYLHDDWCDMQPELAGRIGLYHEAAMQAGIGLEWVELPVVGQGVKFRSEYATNSDQQLANWNRVVPHLRHQRAVTQNCSLKLALVKVEI